MGQKKITFHAPGADACVTSVNSLPGSRPTTAVRRNSGKRSPTVAMSLVLLQILD
jgi:hypothetical protein